VDRSHAIDPSMEILPWKKKVKKKVKIAAACALLFTVYKGFPDEYCDLNSTLWR